MVTKFTDLPIEMIVEIFSYLNVHEVHNAAILCSKFYQASKHPSSCRRCKVVFVIDGNDYKVPLFCDFFMQKPSYLRELYLHTAALGLFRNFRKVHLNSFRLLFQNLTHLRCLSTDINLKNFVLPPSLQHLECTLKGSCVNRETMMLTCLDNCPNIEQLFLTDSNYFYSYYEFKHMFLKYKLTLTSFCLKTNSYFNVNWITMCKNLKQFYLHTQKVLEVKNTDLIKSLFSSLEILVLKNVGPSVLHCLSQCVFPELKHVTIARAPSNSLQVCLPLVINKMPKLQAFCFSVIKKNISRSKIDVLNLVRCLESCETLKYVVIDDIYNCCLDDLVLKTKIETFNAGSSLENQWKISSPFRDETLDIYSYACCCWDPSKNLLNNYIDGQQRKLLLKL